MPSPARLLGPLALVCLVALVGCTAEPAPAPSPSETSTTTPIEISAQGLQDYLDAQADAQGVPGAFLLLRTPDGEFTAAYGVREFGGSEPVTGEEHIRVGSNTKTMTGTVILQLVDEGLLRLDDPVSTYRPDVPNGENITIAELLNMRSGLANYTETYELNAAMDADAHRAWDPEDLIEMGLALPTYFEPDQGYHYSNTNTVLLGRIAEQLTGEKLEDLMRERLFAPFGLDGTSLPSRDETALPEPFARGYMFGSNVLTMSSGLPIDLLQDARDGLLAPGDWTEQNPSWGWAAGAGVSTAQDLADWAEVLADGEALSPEMQKARLDSLQPTSDAPGATRYGYALAQLGSFLGHTGELPGYNVFMGHDPDTDTTLIVWANLAPTPEGTDPATQIARPLAIQLGGD